MKLSTLFSILLLLATATAIYLGEDHDEDFVLEESLEDDQHIRRLRPAGLNKKKLSRAERQAIRQKKREERKAAREKRIASTAKRDFIVVLNEGVDADDLKGLDLKGRIGKIVQDTLAEGEIGAVYKNVFHGFTIALPSNKADKMVRQLEKSPYIKSVEEDEEEEMQQQLEHWSVQNTNINVRHDGVDDGDYVDADIVSACKL